MNRPIVLLSLLAFALSACTKPSASPSNEGVVEQARLESTEIEAAFVEQGISWDDVIARGTVGDDWLETFGDPRLESIVDEALRNNRDLTATAANLHVAAGFATQAGAALTPAVSVGGNSQSTGVGDTINVSGVALNLQWELDLWGLLSAAASAAEGSFRTSEAKLEGARQSLIAQTVKAWFLATETNLQLSLSQEALETYEQMLQIAESRLEAGAASPQDVSHARADLDAAKERQRRGIGALVQAVRSIEAILGRYPSAELENAETFVPAPPSIPIGVLAELLERRPDLIAAERRVAAAFQRIEAARAAKLPKVALTASGGAPSDELINLLEFNNNFFSLGANFVTPLDFDSGTNAQVEIETVQQHEALAGYGRVALRALSEIENALSRERLLAEREAFLVAELEVNEDALARARTQHELGRIDFFSVLQLQAQSLNSRISLTRIRYARLAQRVDLHLALGGDFEN